MGDLRLSVEIAAPRDRVFVFFVPQRMPLWYLPEMQTEFEVSGGESDFRAGQKVRISGRLANREVSLVTVVQRYEWLRSLDWEFKDSYGVRGRQTWEVEEVPGGTRVAMHERYMFPGRFGRWLDPILMQPGVRSRDKRMLERLKRLAEGVNPR